MCDEVPGLPEELRLICPRSEIAARVAAMGAQIARDYEGKSPIFISVLRGAVIFLSDLVRATPIPVRMDFMSISRYQAAEATGVVRIVKDLELNIHGEHVLVVEDIVDTGLTLNYLLTMLRARGPASLKVATLLDKSARRIVELPIDYVGLEIGDVFAVGYGLDVDEVYRNLPDLYAVKVPAGLMGNPEAYIRELMRAGGPIVPPTGVS